MAPTAFAFTRHGLPAVPTLWVVTVYCLVALVRSPGFEPGVLWNTSGLRRYAPAILTLFSVVAAIGTVLVLRYSPAAFLSFPRSNLVLWTVVMVLYPLLSVFPQGIVYRLFLFTRYGELFGTGWGMVLASAAAFAYVHIVFRNPLTLGLSFLAGLLFAARYLKTRSLVVSDFEHSLYGCAL